MATAAANAERFARLHLRDKPADYRTDGERDSDRILYTTELRRLAGVTQVVAAAEGHIFHNRLTHTIEVAQIAFRLATRLLRQQGPDIANEVGGIDPDVAEAAALAHDLGHPPFGHIAEEELDKLVKHNKVSDGFEGNAQSFRIITKLALRRDGVPGLNLTRATLNATLKYPWHRQSSGFREKKWGAYHTEGRELEWAREICEAGFVRTVEAEIMDWADDIAYSVHDVEDFYRGGLIPLERLAKDTEVQQFFDGVFTRWETQGRDPGFTRAELEEAFKRVARSIPVLEPYDGGLAQQAALRNFTSVLIGRYVDELGLRRPYPGSGSRVAINPDAQREVTMLKELTWHYVIRNPALASQQLGQRKIIERLFEVYLESVLSDRTLVPRSSQQRLAEAENLAKSPEEKHAVKVRAVADLVAGLTEQAALDIYRRVIGVTPGNLTDLLIR